MVLPEADLPWWWIAVLSTSIFAAVAISALVPFSGLRDSKGKKVEQEELSSTGAQGPGRVPEGRLRKETREEAARALQKEPWCPKLELKEWHQASQMPGCPWNFDSCEGLGDVMERIWRKPLCTDLQKAFEALSPRVRNVQVARAQVAVSEDVHFAIVYTLNTGAELFGGVPLEDAVGLEMGDEGDGPAVPGGGAERGLRQRRGPAAPALRRPSEGLRVALPALLPFYRIHDGFGVLLSVRHLPVLLASPGDSVNGSCFYVYPTRGLERVETQPRSGLVRFARVDGRCLACADARLEVPKVVYVEKNGERFEDDEPLLAFVADTVSNVAGERVVPPSYMCGPSSLMTAAGNPAQH